MKLIIVESPAKAATIQKYVGDEYVVEATMGHIVDLGKGGFKGIGVDINNNFKPHYVIDRTKIALLDNLIQQAEKSDEIFLASDPDREGEAIAFHLQTRLGIIRKPISRIEFKEMTKSGIQSGLATKRDVNINLFKSQEARRILDRIVGFMVSPYLINNYGSNLSAGRVQSVAVRMIVDREKEIKDFKSEEFWNIFARFKTHSNEEFSAKFNGRPISKDETDTIIKLLKSQNDFYVFSVSGAKKKEKPCPPMTTAALQQYMAKNFSFEPDHTMQIAQSLYENGYCTYIRTDSTRISDEAISSVRSWMKENKLEVPKKPNIYTAKSSAQDAHECIRPTNVSNTPDNSIFSGDAKEVYKAIWQHFIASQMNPSIWNTMNVSIKSKTDAKISFSASGKALDSYGYLKIFGDIDPGKIDIPNLEKGDILFLSNNNPVKSEQKFTQHLPRYNNFSFLKELEGRQIGRPATYAEIIKKISNRNYVEKIGSTYRPTDLGIKITDILVGLFSFMDYEYTSRLEKQLDEIEAGSLDSLNMLKGFFGPFKEKLDQAYKSSGGTICNKCGSVMINRIVKETGSKFLGCSGWPKCHSTLNISNNESKINV